MNQPSELCGPHVTLNPNVVTQQGSDTKVCRFEYDDSSLLTQTFCDFFFPTSLRFKHDIKITFICGKHGRP